MQRDFLNIAAAVGAVLVLAVGGPWAVREIRAVDRHAPLAARANQRIVSLDVTGMTCSGCAAKIESKLAAVPGVAHADVRLRERRAYVVCATDLPDSTLLAAVTAAAPGYRATLARR